MLLNYQFILLSKRKSLLQPVTTQAPISDNLTDRINENRTTRYNSYDAFYRGSTSRTYSYVVRYLTQDTKLSSRIRGSIS